MYYATDLVARYNVLTTACTYTIYSYVSYIVCSLKSWIQPGLAHFPSCLMCTETWNNIVLPTVNSNLQPGLNIIDKLEVIMEMLSQSAFPIDWLLNVKKATEGLRWTVVASSLTYLGFCLLSCEQSVHGWWDDSRPGDLYPRTQQVSASFSLVLAIDGTHYVLPACKQLTRLTINLFHQM